MRDTKQRNLQDNRHLSLNSPALQRSKVSVRYLVYIMGLEMGHHLYHPFQSQSFGVLLPKISSLGNHSGFAIDDIDLYDQPVQNPTIALVFFLIRIPLVILGEIFYLKQLALIRRETGITNDVSKLVAYVQMIFWPILLIFTTSTDFLYPLNELVGEWFCDVGWFFIHLCWNIIAFHSFIVAMMRYCFVVHYETFDKGYRKNKVKRFFLVMSVLVPLMMVVWDGIEGSEWDTLTFINKCNGKHHQVFLIETSTLEVLKRNFCEFDDYDSTGGVFGQFDAVLRRISCISRKTLLLMLGFNFSEAIIYFLTLSHINR